MNRIQVLDKAFVPFIAETTILQKIKEMAAQINADYEGKKPLFIGILNGSFMFAADLFRNITIEAEISFIKLASYKGTKSTGTVVTSIGLDVDVSNRHIIIVEDIVDTGKTLHEFLPQLQNQQPASLKIAVLLHKPDAQQHALNIDYTCFTIPNKFVLGYGLDYDGFGRNIREIYQLSE
jgi:hypoxanthine phosphoribosyltransferase